MKKSQYLQGVGEKWERVAKIKKMIFKSDHVNDKEGSGKVSTTDEYR